MNIIGYIGLFGLLTESPPPASPQNHADSKPALTAKTQVEISAFKWLMLKNKNQAIKEKASFVLSLGELTDPSPSVIQSCQGLGYKVIPYSQSKELRLGKWTNKINEFRLDIRGIRLEQSRALVHATYWCGGKCGYDIDFTLSSDQGAWKIVKDEIKGRH